MRKEGAANKGMLVLLGVIIIAVVATVVIMQRGKEVPVPVQTPPPAPAPAPVTPIVETPPPPPAPPAAAVEKPAEPAPEPPVEVAKADTPKEPLNARTIAGTKWAPPIPMKQSDSMMNAPKLEFEFAPDGTWRINGNVRAKWTVEGKRVKVFDDKGEVHYIDIEGDKLTFNGEVIQRLN